MLAKTEPGIMLLEVGNQCVSSLFKACDLDIPSIVLGYNIYPLLLKISVQHSFGTG